MEGWFASDFTLAELKTLRKRQPHDFRDPTFNGQFTIATLAELIVVVKSASRPAAVYAEIKNPTLINTFFDILRNTSQRIEDIVLKVLEKYRTIFHTSVIYYSKSWSYQAVGDSSKTVFSAGRYTALLLLTLVLPVCPSVRPSHS